MKVRAFFTAIFLSALLVPRPAAHAQLFPVQCTPQLVPPYSVYLSDYASPGNERLRVILVQRDLSQPSYQLRLVMSIELNGRIIMRTSRTFTPPPLNLEPGIPTIISGPDLAGYLDSRNIDFVGYSREQYERTRALPEGSYRILFTAYDYRRQDVQVSNEGSSFYYLAKNEPPLINFPPCGTRLPTRNPYQIVFSWMPRNTASPNSAAETQYEFSLYETRPPGRNPNDVVLTTPPIYRAVTDFPQLVYGPAEPLLFEGMQYVWRVQAQDKNGRDAFRNNGFTEVCAFTYGGTDISFEVGMLKGLQAQGETERRARIWWEAGDYESYRIEYKKTGQGFEWFRSDVKAQANGVPNLEIKLFDLEPDTEYETRAQGMKAGVFGPYTDVIKFRTTPLRVAQCGQPTVLPTSTGKPIPFLTSGMIINARGMELQMVNATVADVDGWYKGTGRVSVPYLGGAVFNVKFDRIFIDADRNVTAGRIDFVTKGVAAMVEQQLAGQQNRERERKQRENREQWKDVVFYEKIFKYDMPIISAVVGDNDAIVLYDQQNIQHINRDIATVLQEHPGKAVVIEDKNGEQYVVQKDKTTGKTTVTKVEGGGLIFGPDGKMLNEKELRKFDKFIIASLRKYKKEIEDYLAPTKQTGKGPNLTNWEDAAKLSDCLAPHAERVSAIGANIASYLVVNSPEQEAFLESVTLKLAEEYFDLDPAKESETQEKTDGVVCEALVEGDESAMVDTDCNPSLVPESLRSIADRAKQCDNGVDDDLEKISEADLAKLCVAQRIDLIKCVDGFPAQGGDDEILIKLLTTTPSNYRAKLMSRLQDEKIYENRLIEAVDGEEFIELVNTISQWMGTPKQADWENAVIANKFLFFDGDDAFLADFDGTSMVFKTRKNFTIGWYQEVTVKPHEFVAVTFTNDFIVAGKEFEAGNQVTMSGLAVWSLFNEMFNKRLRAGGAVALDIPLLFVGVGEVTALKNVVGVTRAIRALRYARATANIVIAAGGLVMASGIEDELTLTEDGRETLRYWTWFNLIYAGGTLTPHAINSAKGLYSSCKNLLTRPGLSESVKNSLKAWMETLTDIFKKNGQNIDEIADLVGASGRQYKTKNMLGEYVGEETGSVWGTSVKYLTSEERNAYELFVSKEGKLVDKTGLLFTTEGSSSVFASGQGKAIFVMDDNGRIFASKTQKVGEFHHSSFLGGKPVAAAGEIEVQQGVIKSISNRSGHYQPDHSFTNQFINELTTRGVKDADKIPLNGF